MVAEYSDTTKGEWQQIIKDFEAANPTITVNLSVVSWTNIYDVVTTNIQSGTPPDILNLDAYSPYAASGLLYPAKDIVSPAVLSDFERPFAEESTINGTQWALPFIASARALFYNKTIFAKAGLSAPPKTWAELEADAKAIKAAGYIGYGMPLGNEEAQAEGAYWFYGAGGGYGTASKITIDTPQNIAGATEMQKLINAGLTEPNAGATYSGWRTCGRRPARRECRDVLAEDLDEFRRRWHSSRVTDATVLQLTVLVCLAGVCPGTAGVGGGPQQDQLIPAGFRE